MAQSKTKWRNYQGKSEWHPDVFDAGYLFVTWRGKPGYKSLLQGFVNYDVNIWCL